MNSEQEAKRVALEKALRAQYQQYITVDSPVGPCPFGTSRSRVKHRDKCVRACVCRPKKLAGVNFLRWVLHTPGVDVYAMFFTNPPHVEVRRAGEQWKPHNNPTKFSPQIITIDVYLASYLTTLERDLLFAAISKVNTATPALLPPANTPQTFDEWMQESPQGTWGEQLHNTRPPSSAPEQVVPGWPLSTALRSLRRMFITLARSTHPLVPRVSVNGHEHAPACFAARACACPALNLDAAFSSSKALVWEFDVWDERHHVTWTLQLEFMMGDVCTAGWTCSKGCDPSTVDALVGRLNTHVTYMTPHDAQANIDLVEENFENAAEFMVQVFYEQCMGERYGSPPPADRLSDSEMTMTDDDDEADKENTVGHVDADNTTSHVDADDEQGVFSSAVASAPRAGGNRLITDYLVARPTAPGSKDHGTLPPTPAASRPTFQPTLATTASVVTCATTATFARPERVARTANELAAWALQQGASLLVAPVRPTAQAVEAVARALRDPGTPPVQSAAQLRRWLSREVCQRTTGTAMQAFDVDAAMRKVVYFTDAWLAEALQKVPQSAAAAAAAAAACATNLTMELD